MTPVFFDPHACEPPPTADLIGREMDFECRCGRRWRLQAPSAAMYIQRAI